MNFCCTSHNAVKFNLFYPGTDAAAEELQIKIKRNICVKLSLLTEMMARKKKKRFRNEPRGRKNTALPETVKHILLTEKGMHIKKAVVDKE